MKVLIVIAVSWLLFFAVVMTAAAIDGGLSPGPTQSSPRTAVVTDIRNRGMLEADLRMLERMRVATSPAMNAMIELDPMWVDPDMIRAQEQYQAQLDRMIGRP